MKPLFTQEEYDAVRYQDKLPCECYQCGEKFYTTKHEISRFIKRGESAAKFCSKSCNAKFKAINHKKECPKCKVLISFCNLSKHMKRCLSGKEKYERKFKGDSSVCPYCDEKFGKLSIGNHIYLNHEGGKEIHSTNMKKYYELNGPPIGRPQMESTKEKLRISSSKHKHSEETKNKLRIAKIKYYQENPDKIPFKLYNYEEKSRPEKLFEHALSSSTISNSSNYVYEFKFNIYRFDFAWVDLKLDVEIDGDFHLKPERIIRDELRDEFSIKNGWTVVRFEAKLVNKNPEYCISKLEHIFNNFELYQHKKIKFWYKDYINEKAVPN